MNFHRNVNEKTEYISGNSLIRCILREIREPNNEFSCKRNEILNRDCKIQCIIGMNWIEFQKKRINKRWRREKKGDWRERETWTKSVNYGIWLYIESGGIPESGMFIYWELWWRNGPIAYEFRGPFGIRGRENLLIPNLLFDSRSWSLTFKNEQVHHLNFSL